MWCQYGHLIRVYLYKKTWLRLILFLYIIVVVYLSTRIYKVYGERFSESFLFMTQAAENKSMPGFFR